MQVITPFNCIRTVLWSVVIRRSFVQPSVRFSLIRTIRVKPELIYVSEKVPEVVVLIKISFLEKNNRYRALHSRCEWMARKSPCSSKIERLRSTWTIHGIGMRTIRGSRWSRLDIEHRHLHCSRYVYQWQIEYVIMKKNKQKDKALLAADTESIGSIFAELWLERCGGVAAPIAANPKRKKTDLIERDLQGRAMRHLFNRTLYHRSNWRKSVERRRPISRTLEIWGAKKRYLYLVVEFE